MIKIGKKDGTAIIEFDDFKAGYADGKMALSADGEELFQVTSEEIRGKCEMAEESPELMLLGGLAMMMEKVKGNE